MSTTTTEELAQGWIRALSDVDAFHGLCAAGCRVWHSTDDKWITVEEAVDAVHERGGLPEFENPRYTLTGKGFFVQTSATLAAARVHVIQVVTVEDGKAISAEEYVGPEMDIAV
ncbi:hypothetical protein [Amycolatopsis australiensis]|uniref:SnoaL-like domain-containing protein n=1 Tax=Amycolatopsis australiensis TaxID=546364 RepID=A0A1K1S6V2_9PSEU|nr:hypothetical protein [Amycolatopsis australiensis]SFW79796.1 hypothetical protein SAMN04489730_4835 [Amycolatopsis australiensis]